MKILLIDGDQFIFKATAAVEKETRWDDQNHVLYSNAEECWHNLTGMLERVFERFDSREHALTFSSPDNFRLKIDPTYKTNRKATRKPLCYGEMVQRCQATFNCVSMPTLEADDVMGILATKPMKAQRIIVSADKDMRTIPTTVWNGKDMYNLSEEDADRFHMYQTLIGDAADGYKGCPGVGPVKADKILDADEAPGDTPEKGEHMETEGLMWPRVVHAYKKAGLTEEDALTQARLARILRWSDWNSETKTPILWAPSRSV